MYQCFCGYCDEYHPVESVKFLNVEEGFSGEDILTFVCPETDEIQRSFVYNFSRDSDFEF